jgi:hypothetical protein
MIGFCGSAGRPFAAPGVFKIQWGSPSRAIHLKWHCPILYAAKMPYIAKNAPHRPNVADRL